MRFETIKIENLSENQSVCIVTLNRPEVKNAFNPKMIQELSDFFQSVDHQKVSLVILKGEGSAFCAGADLNWMKSMVNFTYEENIEDSNRLWNMFFSIQNCKVPVVAVAQGAVYGGGLGLLACCDFVCAEENTQFCFSEVKLGLVPAVISDFICKKIPDVFVRPYMLSASVFSVSEAKKIGLIHESFSGDISLESLAKKFSSNGAEAMSECKMLLNYYLTSDSPEERKAKSMKVITERRMSEEAQKKLQNFLSKKN